MDTTFKLPAAMEPFRAQLLQTTQSFIRVKAQPARNTKPWESKVGGAPYLPIGTPYPTTPEGLNLFFLAQINFEEMPALAPFPQKGLVQFYINDDDLYGMDFDDGANQDQFRVLYFPEVLKNEKSLQSTHKMLRDYDLLPHHPETSHPLQFEMAEEVVPSSDYRFWQHFDPSFFQQFGEKEWDVMDEFGRAVRAQGHKVGGYAYFTQDDPRRKDDPMLLLFQLDSDEGMDLMWGDMGVGHFFIRESDLKSGDFSKVLYDWDCL
jgi:uncharacterized protein YwqG